MIKKTLLFGIFVGLVFVIAPSIILAEGGEGQCPSNLVQNPPHYSGNVTVNYVENASQECPYPGCAYLSGILESAGNKGLSITLTNVFYEGAVTPQQFQSHTPQDLRGRCITAYPEIGIFEVVGAHHLAYNNPYQFTVDLVIMPMVNK
jgi:hypothetical protein